MVGLEKWELGGLAKEQAETIEAGEHCSITYPEDDKENPFAHMSKIRNLFEFWSRIRCRPLPVPGEIFLSVVVVVFPCISRTSWL